MTDKPKKFCHFCGLREDVLDFLVMKDEDIGICDRCIRMCAIVGQEMKAQKMAETASPSDTLEKGDG